MKIIINIKIKFKAAAIEDERILETLNERMYYAGNSGIFKKRKGVFIFQPERWNDFVTRIKFLTAEKNYLKI